MTKISANLSWLFTEVPFIDRFGQAADCGFKAVEWQWPSESPSQVAAQMKKLGLKTVLFNLNAGEQPGDRGIAAIPGREADFERTVDQAIEMALAVECPRYAPAWPTPRKAGRRHREDERHLQVEPAARSQKVCQARARDSDRGDQSAGQSGLLFAQQHASARDHRRDRRTEPALPIRPLSPRRSPGNLYADISSSAQRPLRSRSGRGKSGPARTGRAARSTSRSFSRRSMRRATTAGSAPSTNRKRRLAKGSAGRAATGSPASVLNRSVFAREAQPRSPKQPLACGTAIIPILGKRRILKEPARPRHVLDDLPVRNRRD